jgi:hypothetical protein
MGILFDQSERLLREKWPTAQLLAEELFAIFRQQEPTNIDTATNINPDQPTNLPALTINNSTGNGPIITFIKGNCTASLNFDANCNLIITPVPDEDAPPGTIGGGGGGGTVTGGGGMLGIVQSGSSDTYQVQIAGTPKVVTAKVPNNIDPSETVPVGYEAPLFLVGTGTTAQYVLYIPLWL